MKFNNRQNECVTTTDGREIWVSRSVAVTLTGVLTIRGGGTFVLVSKRGEDVPDFSGYWCLPCGYMDWDESGPEAVAREAWEEVGLDITPYFDMNSQPWYVKTDPSENRQNISLRYGFWKVVDMLPKLIPNNEGEGNEVAAAEWVSLRDVDKRLYAFNHLQSIHDYMKHIGMA